MDENLKNLLSKIEVSEPEKIPFSLMPILYQKIKEKELVHSDIIAYLISDSTDNKKSQLFLKLFLNHIKVDEKYYGNFSNLKVITEYSIENKRRIDILITWDKYAIIIENKLNDAPDLHNQLSDYYNAIEGKEIETSSGRQKLSVLKVVYMPLFQSKKAYIPSVNLPEDIVVNFYPKKIIDWLEDCISSSDIGLAEPEIIACVNYITLLKHINQINRNTMETKKILETLNHSEFKKLVDVAQIVKSNEWENEIMNTIEKLFEKKVKDCKMKVEAYKGDNENKKSFLQLWCDNYKFWIEIYTYNGFLCVYTVYRGDKKDSETIFNYINYKFNNSESDSNTNNEGKLKQFYRHNEDAKFKYAFDFSNLDSKLNNKFVNDVIELLDLSIK
jgi:hypothetical protein